MATTPSGLASAVGQVERWTSRLLSAAGGKFGLLLVALVALMGAAPQDRQLPVGAPTD
jgi:hypothetical protein